MIQYLTVENATLVLVILLSLEKVLRRIAPMTSTTRDDDLVAGVDKARAWVRTYAPLVVAIVEDLAETGKIPAAMKAQEYMDRIEIEWRRANCGAALPASAAVEARLVAAGIAATIPHHAGAAENPPTGPAPR